MIFVLLTKCIGKNQIEFEGYVLVACHALAMIIYVEVSFTFSPDRFNLTPE